jgi:two-component system osmolarity sensor histidine kinase EnvZ
MERARSYRLDSKDWLWLVLCMGTGVALGLLALQLLLSTILEPVLLRESSLRIARNVRLVEVFLGRIPTSQLPAGVVLHRGKTLPEVPVNPSGFEQKLAWDLAEVHGLRRTLLRDRPPTLEPWGGYWILLHGQQGPGSTWLYQPNRLSTNVWFLPLLRSVLILLGLLGGIVVFLTQWVERPFRMVLQNLPDTDTPPVRLLSERGIAPLRRLSLGINRLLERLNDADRARRSMLQGLCHDLASPQARLALRLEALQETSANADPFSSFSHDLEAMERDLRSLAALTSRIGLLAAEGRPRSQPSWLGLDDLCGRLISAYPSGQVRLDVPRLVVFIDGLALERALANLVDNGLEHGEPPVLIQARRRGLHLLLEVEDGGSGFAHATQRTMTTPPHQSDRQRSRPRGLGLSIVEAFCRDHGGRMMTSRNRRGGLRVSLELAGVDGQPLFQDMLTR